MKIIFILSLPRSGSTLLQRLLASHPEISTVSEPWIQLPLLSMLIDTGIYTNYNHKLCRIAIDEIIDKLPNKNKDIYDIISYAGYSIYYKLNPSNTEYFLDKTPRYHLICEELKQIYPEAKFIILWRNPLAIVSSIVKTWLSGNWKIYQFKIDLYEGFYKLLNFSTKNPDVLQIKYEELLDNTEHTLLKLCKYLNINQNEITNYLDTTIEGSMGDPNQDKFKKIEKTGNWYISYNTYFRKLWAKKYLMWIGDKNLSLMGYNSMEIHQKIKDIKNDGPFLMDFLFNIISIAHSWIEPTILREKLKNKIKRISHA